MNVTCPNCATVYRVDPAKVPEAGVRARCAVCSAVFPVRREADVGTPASVVTAVAPRPAAPPVSGPTPASAPAPKAAPVAAPPAGPAAASVPEAPTASRPTMLPRPAAPAFAPSPPPLSTPPRPAAEPVRPAPPATPRPVNPFLSQDPALKARRLARALISDMVVYHPAKRQEGLRDGTLKQLFEEEIKKSWDEYAEQVGREIAESSPYFREALNEILAGGEQVF
jgi:predicted Zn finger-like uncharacterized protein